VRLTIDLHEDLVKLPSPLAVTSTLANSSLPDLRGGPWAKPVAPEPNCFVADIATALKQEIFDLPQ